VPGGWAALAIGLFNSIMFPVIFTITLERSTASEEATSGFLCFSIVGGAILPLIVGLVSQHSSYVTAFIVPACCYAVLFLFSLASGRARTHLRDEPAAATIH
jgi:FHS family L-fucose permease-like MFS transporter